MSRDNTNSSAIDSTNHFHIAEYASFNPDRISNSIRTLNTCSVQPLLPQGSEEHIVADAPNYSVVQPKAKRMEQPCVSSDSPQEEVRNTDDVDFTVEPTTPVLPQSAPTDSTYFDRAEQQLEVGPGAMTTSTRRTFTEGSTLFSSADKKTNTKKAELDCHNSFHRSGSVDNVSLHTFPLCKQRSEKPLPPLPINVPNICTTFHKSLNLSPAPLHFSDKDSSILSPFEKENPIRVGSDCNSLVSAYEIPIRSSPNLVQRSKSFSVNQEPSSATAISPILSRALGSSEGPKTDEKGDDTISFSTLRVQFSTCADSLPHAEQPRLTTV